MNSSFLFFLAQAATATPATVSDAATADDIHDIRGLILIPSPWAWLRWGVIGLVALGLLWAAWEAWQRRKRKRVPPDPLEVALAELEKTRALLRPGTAREFSIAVSQIVRAYIETRFAEQGVRAAHRTTEEFLHDLASRADSPLAPYRGLLGEFLGHCDRAKFGRWALSVTEMEALLQSARGFLVDSKPAPPVESAKAGKSKTKAEAATGATP